MNGISQIMRGQKITSLLINDQWDDIVHVALRKTVFSRPSMVDSTWFEFNSGLISSDVRLLAGKEAMTGFMRELAGMNCAITTVMTPNGGKQAVLGISALLANLG